jgi:hypothetical protein
LALNGRNFGINAHFAFRGEPRPAPPVEGGVAQPTFRTAALSASNNPKKCAGDIKPALMDIKPVLMLWMSNRH